MKPDVDLTLRTTIFQRDAITGRFTITHVPTGQTVRISPRLLVTLMEARDAAMKPTPADLGAAFVATNRKV